MADMESEWYAVIEGKQAGPYSAQELQELNKSGGVHADTLVWREGMRDWEPFSSVGDTLKAAAEQSSRAPVPTSSGTSFTPTANSTTDSPYAAPKAELETPGGATSFGSNSPYGPYVDPMPRSRTLQGFLIVSMVTAVVAMITYIMQAQLMERLAAGFYDADAYDTAAIRNDERVNLVNTTWFGLSIACGLAWVFWTRRVMKNAWAINSHGMDTSPGWAVGWFFVPIASLWKPFTSLREAWDITIPSSGGIINLWWTMFIVTRIADTVARAFASSHTTLHDAIISTNVAIVDCVINMLSAFVALLMVRKLSRSQADFASRAKAQT